MKNKRILSKTISLILCVLVLFGSVTVAYGNTDVDIASCEGYTENVGFAERFIDFIVSIFPIGTETSSDNERPEILTPFFVALMWESPLPLSGVKSVLSVGTKVDVISYSGCYCLVETKNDVRGYVFYSWIKNKPDFKLSLNRTFDHVYHDGTNFDQTTQKPRTQAIYNGRGKVTYSTDNTDIISVDSKTGLIKGKNPGKANLIVTVGSEKQDSIPVYCVYRWDKPWTGKANKSTSVCSYPSTDADKVAALSLNSKFIVTGDDGYSESMAYGYIQGTNTWGFVKIKDISTKNTISYYNNLKWLWPIKNTSFNFISSSYGPRNVEVGSSNHKGIDVSGNNILGEPLVAPFDGIVRKSGYDSSCGNYICITSETIDPVTNGNLIIIYMHMESTALYDKGEEVSKGETVGYIGTTGASSGPHLHAEMNNRNAAVGESARTTYSYTINPLYFYRDMELRFYEDEAYKNHGGYWYSTNN